MDLTDADLPEAGTGGAPDEIVDATWTACVEEQTSHFIPDLSGRLNRFIFTVYLPPRNLWNDGVRWARCDVSIAKLGSKYVAPEYQMLPADIEVLADSYTKDPVWYELCIDTAQLAAARSPIFSATTATYADCTARPQWWEFSSDAFPDDEGTRLFPTDSEFDAFTQTSCGDSAEAGGYLWQVTAPTTESWKTGDRWVTCWVALTPFRP